ncbi:MAG: hypothetical protein ACFFE3_03785, partial [Candidatus Thorarchaeota archaeon]
CNNVTGAAIDNLVVDDDPDEFWNHVGLHTPPPPIDWILIAVGGGVTVAVIALVVVFVKRR